MADITVTAANVQKASGATQGSSTAAASITAGQALYTTTSNTVGLADCTDATKDLVVGIALHAASAGQPIAYCTAGGIDVGATLTVGTIYVLSEAGGIAPAADLTSDDYVTVLGVATAADNLALQISVSSVQVP